MSDSQQHVGKAFLLEFPIPGRDSARAARECVGYIERLFSVQVSIPGTQTRQGEWVSVQGRQTNIAKAKKYILALCTPEVRMEACRQPHFARLLFNSGSSVRCELERDYQTVLSSDHNGTVHVQGEMNDVYATVSKLRSLQDTLANGSTHLPPSQPPVSTVAASTSLQSTSSGREVDKFLHELPPNVKQALYDTISHQAPPYHQQVISRGTDPRREKRIEYFVNLGYTREKVEAVLCTLPEAPDDMILARLVQFTPQAKPPVDLAEVGSMDPLPVNPESLRHIVIDGSNVAMRHGNGQVFSCKGIQLAVDYFKKRGHTNITVFIPEWRKEASTPDSRITDQHILSSLEVKGHLKYTPSRQLIEGRRIVCYDDRFIVKLATDESGVIVSNDQFRDLVNEKAEWKETIETRLLQFTFVSDYFMPPDDPLGRNGPSLDQLLSKDPLAGQHSRLVRRPPPQSNLKLCPHLERCTFGKKCKYWHPEREPASSSGSNSSHTPSTSRSPTPSPSPDKRYMIHPTRSREDLIHHESGYSTSGDMPLGELTDHMSGMSLGKPEPPQYINLQPRLQEYPQQVMRSTPTLPQEPPMLVPADPGHQERRHIHTFPLMNLSQGATNYVDRRRGVTEDFTHRLTHSTHHALTPSHPHRPHTIEHELRGYDGHVQHPHIGLPGPHPPNVLPREPPNRYMRPSYHEQGDPYQQRVSPRHFHPPPQTHSHSYPHLPPSHNTPPPRSRTQSDYGSQRYDTAMFEKALAVLPNCEQLLRRVFAANPGISSYEEAVELAHTME